MGAKKKSNRRKQSRHSQCKWRCCRKKNCNKVVFKGMMNIVLFSEHTMGEAKSKSEKSKDRNDNIVKAVFYATTVSILASAFLSSSEVHTINVQTINVYGYFTIFPCARATDCDSSSWMIPLAYFLFFTGYFYDEWQNKLNAGDSQISLTSVANSWTFKLCHWLCLKLAKLNDNLMRQNVMKPYAKHRSECPIRTFGGLLEYGELFEVLAWMSFVIQASLATQPYSSSIWWGVLGTVFATLSLKGNNAKWTIDAKMGWMIENVIWIIALLVAFMSYLPVFPVAAFIFVVKVFFWVDRKLHIQRIMESQ